MMKPWQTIVWNEWRQCRWAFTLVFAIIIIAWAVMLWFTPSGKYLEKLSDLIFVSFLLLPFGCTFVTSSNWGELKSGTLSFLLNLPISPARILFIKYAFSLVSQIFFQLLSLTGYIACVVMSRKHEDLNLNLVVSYMIFMLAFHNCIFFVNMIYHKANPLRLYDLIWVIGVILFIPGIFYTTTYFYTKTLLWVTYSILIWISIVAILNLGTGLYLWKNRIYLNLRSKKTLFIACVVLALLSLLSWSISVGVSYRSLSKARREARAAGVTLEFAKSASTPVPKEQNALPGLQEFFKKYESLLRKTEYHKFITLFPSEEYRPHGKLSPYIYIYYDVCYLETLGQSVKITLEKAQEAPSFIIDNKEMRKLNQLLDHILMKPELSLDLNNSRSYYDDYLCAMKAIELAANYIFDRALVQAKRRNFTEFSTELERLVRLGDYLKNIPFLPPALLQLRIQTLKYHALIIALPDEKKFVPQFQEMLKPVEDDKFFLPCDSVIHANLHPNSLSIPVQYPYSNIGKLAWFFLLPRIMQDSTEMIEWAVKRRELQSQASKFSFYEQAREIDTEFFMAKPAYLFTGMQTADKPLDFYFSQRCISDMSRISLALKIFKAENGRFPDKLDELSPEILPKVPIDTMNGKPFHYQRKGDGFRLDWSRSQHSEFHIDYQPSNGK